MTDDERDALLLGLKTSVERLEGKVDGLTVYVKAMAGRLLPQAEINDIEGQVLRMNYELYQKSGR